MPDVAQLSGHQFHYRYDNGVAYVITFESNQLLRWDAIAGPDQGMSATETYDSVQVAPNVHFITWLEGDGTVISQVADYNQMIVYTSLTCHGNQILLKGKLD